MRGAAEARSGFGNRASEEVWLATGPAHGGKAVRALVGRESKDNHFI